MSSILVNCPLMGCNMFHIKKTSKFLVDTIFNSIYCNISFHV
uniref:Uncharacterized protein n=1 Tax=Arundo donax TaxID=35708 RepID=A0A0A8ZC27_ARUDO